MTTTKKKKWVAKVAISKAALERYNAFIMHEVEPPAEVKDNFMLMGFVGRFENGYTALLGMVPAEPNVSGAVAFVFRPDGDALRDGTIDLGDWEGLDDVHPNVFPFEADGKSFELHVTTATRRRGAK